MKQKKLTRTGHPSLNSIANIWGSSANRTSELTEDRGRTITTCTHLSSILSIWQNKTKLDK